MIPKTLHQVWVGTNEIPDDLVRWSWSWREYHPDWTLCLWTDSPEMHSGPWHEVARVPALVNSHSLATLRTLIDTGCLKKTNSAYLAALSDVIRMEVIAREGGVYADLDVECFQPIDELLDGVDLFCADECGPCCGNYLFGARKNHPALWTCVRELQLHLVELAAKRAKDGLRVSPVAATGPAYLNHQLRKHGEVVLFPWPLFNPLWAWFEPDQVEHWPSVSYGNHHYAGTWYSRRKRVPPTPFVEGSAA